MISRCSRAQAWLAAVHVFTIHTLPHVPAERLFLSPGRTWTHKDCFTYLGPCHLPHASLAGQAAEVAHSIVTMQARAAIAFKAVMLAA